MCSKRVVFYIHMIPNLCGVFEARYMHHFMVLHPEKTELGQL